MVLVFGSIYVVDCVYRLVYVEPALHPQDDANLIVMDKLFDVLLQSVCQYFFKLHFRFWGTCEEHARLLHRYTHEFASILLKIFTSLFIMNIGLKFSFF